MTEATTPCDDRFAELEGEIETVRGDAQLHAAEGHPGFEYRTRSSPSCPPWDLDDPPGGEGWYRNIHRGVNGRTIDESYWMRPRGGSPEIRTLRRYLDTAEISLETFRNLTEVHLATIARLGASYLDAMAACDVCGVPRVREVTGESITDEEIHHYREYTVRRSGATSRQVDDAVRDCDQARPGYLSERARREARALCAVGFNRMPESERLLTLAERIRWIAQNGRDAVTKDRRGPTDVAVRQEEE